MDGNNWKDHSNWLTNSAVDDWFGVGVREGVVISIRLSRNNLSGNIFKISSFQNLVELELNSNYLEGNLSSLSTFKNLENLELQGNKIDGDLSGLRTLIKLDWLLLADNKIGGNLSPLSKLQQLTYLNLEGNNIEGNLSNIGVLNNLRDLILGHNKISGNLSILNQFQALEKISLETNQIVGDLSEIKDLNKLRILSLTSNYITGNLTDISYMSQLERLTININRSYITGTLDSLKACTKLSSIELEQNSLTGSILVLKTLEKLNFVYLRENMFTFSDLEPLLTENNSLPFRLYYSDQMPVEIKRDLVFTDNNLTITPLLPENPSGNDQYQWYRDGKAIEGATQRIYSKLNATSNDNGVYSYSVTNVNVPDLTLRSHVYNEGITVEVIISDSDNDGIPDTREQELGMNVDSNDSDGDGILDGEEIGDIDSPRDTDGDKVIDALDTDSDDDGMPDAFEYQNGLNYIDSSDADADSDGDGYTNLEEYNAGTDIHDADDKPSPTYTEVCGTIDGNVTWTQAESPYLVTCDIDIPTALTIQEGVEILVQKDVAFNVYGIIKVEGTESNPVVMKSENDTEKWQGIRLKTNSQAQGFFDYLRLSRAYTGLSVECCQGLPYGENAATIDHSIFEYLDTAISGYAGANQIVIQNSIFRHNKYALTSADKTVYNSLFENNEYGVYSTERVSIYNSEFKNNGTALYGGRGELKGCSIHDNEIGVQAHYSGFTTQENNITYNQIGLILGEYDGYTQEVSSNHIYGNREFNVKNAMSYDIAIPNNYWGTTDIERIEDTIYDEDEESRLGKVSVEPVLDVTPPTEDLDGDGVNNSIDNCSIQYNPTQSDFDNDNLGDACDRDDDNDGLPDSFENQYSELNPLDATDANQDSDGDGYTNLEEYEAGTKINDSTDNPSQGTKVCDVLDGNITWTSAKSPYIVTCDLKIKDYLTIKEGVEILVQKDVAINVYGTIDVNGTESNPVVIKSENDTEKWQGIRLKTNFQAQGFFNYMHLSQAYTGLSVECCQGLPYGENAATIDNSVFEDLDTAISGYAGANKIVINNTLFRHNKYALNSADKTVHNCVFENNEYGLYSTERVSVFDSEFRDNDTALYGGRGELNGCWIHDNGIGVQAFFEGFDTQGNRIINNITGVIVGAYDGYTPPIMDNDIYGNSDFNIQHTSGYDINATNNWWGTTDIESIKATIYDKEDDSSLGNVIVSPIRMSSISNDANSTYYVELTRNGWNLISICQDINASDIDMNGIQEIQAQDGQTIYTGNNAIYSNLEMLEAGYGYWIKGAVGHLFKVGQAKGKLEKELKREGWNLMAACEDINRSAIEMSFYREIQSQDGETIYTGAFEIYSNLHKLLRGYGYWVKSDSGVSWIAKDGLSLPSGYTYSVINNKGESIEMALNGYIIKLYSNQEISANAQSSHVGVVVHIGEQTSPVMQIQSTYAGDQIAVGVYKQDDLVGVSELTTVDSSLTHINVVVD